MKNADIGLRFFVCSWFDKFVKASWSKDEEHFQKALHLFENALSCFKQFFFNESVIVK